jgi:glyoxylase-like metal-dependent hydrolase (beta-lactamase superfamily II)/predicted DCC family thiol-disulfide oxidoreductase YuxK
MADRTLVFYDSQCEVCQAGVSWLRFLDRQNRTECLPIDAGSIERAGLDLNACTQQLHVVTPRGVLVGWNAVAHLARLFPATWLIGALSSVPPFQWVGKSLYGWVARNRYALSKCRGGACRSVRVKELERHAPVEALRTCHWFGMLLRLPLSLGAIFGQIGGNCSRFARTYRRRIDFLDGRLQLFMLNGMPCDLITLLFGEHFLMIVYDGIAIDPGPTRLRSALLRQLKRLPANGIHSIVATHHHEEHAGNLNWLAERTGATLYIGEATAECLAVSSRLPWIREFMIGARPQLKQPYRVIGHRVCDLETFPTPGHCHDHICLYDPKEKILFAGDSFMGAYFSAPNPDVDSHAWIDTLRRLLELDIEILVEGHGHIHTLRPDIPDSCPLVVRRDPRQALNEKLRFCEWLQDQIDAGLADGLTLSAIEVTCFPWGRRFSWESFWNDELTRLFSHGHWSRTEMIRSFARPAGSRAVLPLVYEARIHTAPAQRAETFPEHVGTPGATLRGAKSDE